jgi:hypothetical protein
MILACLAAAAILSHSEAWWGLAGPLVLFMGLLTLLSAPFDWASLGLTRALLRRGLELGGWWPYLLALADAVLAGAPEYWWVYALLLSSMIPSFINLVIGGLALTRGIPGLPYLLLNFMPTGKAVPGFDRAWLGLVLTGQIFVGAFLGLAAQALLAWGLIFHVMPWVGLDLLDMARAVAAFDLPARIGQLFSPA